MKRKYDMIDPCNSLMAQDDTEDCNTFGNIVV